jgi:hypothetical protein
MNILQLRKEKTSVSTISELYIDGEFQCFILEDPERELVDKNKDGDFDDVGEGKIWGNTCIPVGTYKPWLRKAGRHYQQYSKRWSWHKETICLDPVPGFKFIMVHIGNTNVDTHGCLLPGNKKHKNSISQSTIAYEKLYKKIYEAVKNKTATWTIKS